MDRLERRISWFYAVAIAVTLVVVTLCCALFFYTRAMGALGAAANDALQVYVKRVTSMAPVRTKNDVEHLIAGTSHPGWVLTVADDRTRYVVRWPSGSITSEPRTSLPPPAFPWNVLNGLATIAGVRLPPKSIVAGTELVLLPTYSEVSIASQTFGITVWVIIIDLLIAASIGRIVARHEIRPLVSLHDALEHMAETGARSTYPVSERSRKDVGALIATYNRAIDALNVAHAERDAAEARTHQFIADAGHQLRTPLTVLNGLIGILLSGRLREPDDGPKMLRKMGTQIAVMRKLVERLMVLEGWQADELPASERTDIGEFVDGVVDPIAAASPEVPVLINVPEHAIARIDPTELSYAVTNLVSNAMKYAAGGTIFVDVTEDAENVYITVADEGPGIPPEELPHIFERFYRGRRRDVPGSGLGLSIAKIAVERAGGTLTAGNREGKGALFTIALPRERSPELALASDQTIDGR